MRILFSSTVIGGLRNTKCYIYDNATDEAPSILAKTRQHPKDKDDRLLGKKYALKLALRGTDRDFRRECWEYFKANCLTKKQKVRMGIQKVKE